jgi:hypothetical protein
MTDRVHGGVHGGEFLTGKMDFFGISTSLLVDQTNVDTPVQDLYQIKNNVWTPVTVVDGHGVSQTYATKADYITAWKSQQNLNTILKLFSLRANPVAVSVTVGEGTQVNIATERTALWYINGDDGNFGATIVDDNATGYKLDTVLETANIFWAAGDDVLTGTPSAEMTIGGNTTLSRRTFL